MVKACQGENLKEIRDRITMFLLQVSERKILMSGVNSSTHFERLASSFDK